MKLITTLLLLLATTAAASHASIGRFDVVAVIEQRRDLQNSCPSPQGNLACTMEYIHPGVVSSRKF